MTTFSVLFNVDFYVNSQVNHAVMIHRRSYVVPFLLWGECMCKNQGMYV